MLRRLLFLTVLSAFSSGIIAQQDNLLNLMPVPKEITKSKGALKLSADFTIGIKADSTDTTLYKAATRMYQSLNRQTGLFLRQQRISSKDNSDTATLLVKVTKKAAPFIGIDESYSLDITDQKIILTSPNTIGALHGMETILQLALFNNGEYYFPLVSINDAPRFEWRGFMIDVARHFIPFEILKRNIDAMAAVKMNVLHLHFSDNEGFRVESKAFPRLHQEGSYGEYYTQSQIKELIAYALERGITTIPEFDIPGHTKSWFAGYPELSSSAGPFTPGPPIDFNALPSLNLGSIMQLVNTAPFPAIDPSKESTYAMLDKFFAEMSSIFPAPYMHIGADENNGVVWKNNPSIVAFMQENKIPDTHALQAYFVSRVIEILKNHKKQTIGWEELYSKDLPGDVTVQVWQNNAYLKQSLEKGNPTLLSKGFYLDLFMPAYIHYNNPDLSVDFSSIGSKLRGGEAALWAEAVDENNMEGRAWPRAAAVAERLWSPASVKDVDDMHRRLFTISSKLDQLGLEHLSRYHRAVRRYTGNDDMAALEDFLDVLTPVKGYKKLFARLMMPASASYQTAPMTAVSDVVFVDNKTKWQFHTAVKSYLAKHDDTSLNIIRNYLVNWQQCTMKLQTLFMNNAELQKVQPHAVNLSNAASVGLEALAMLQKSVTPSAEWTKEKLSIITSADKSFGETELAILPDILALIKQQEVALPASYSPF